METGIRILLLSAALALGGCASIHHLFHRHSDADAQAANDAAADQDNDAHPPRVIEPQVERRKIKVPQIRSHNVEVGVQYGALSIENFGTNPVYGFTAAYHISEDLFFQGAFGRSQAGRTSFETLSNINLLSPSERYFTYYDLSLGYNFLPGEVFLGRKVAMTSAFYLLGGIGSTNFAGDSKFTVNFGGGYRVLPADWIAVHIGVEDHVFQSDLLGVDKLTNNLEATIGASVFF
ncbi:MAG TPA: outer membrane beta-barrel domain-containing protein [Steroidobacteraceae bacterium]|jgi:outer membrane beta-barrel protein|nr:outer membrane beta-barrel domain-containing protein [Steroidobacteraceae bacterium]